MEEQQKDILLLDKSIEVQQHEIKELRGEIEEMKQLFILAHQENQDIPLETEKAEQVYIALKRIEASVNSGVNYHEYSQLVSAAQLEIELVQDYLENESENGYLLIQALALYQRVKEIWNLSLQNGFMNNLKLSALTSEIEQSDEFQSYLKEKGLDPNAKGFVGFVSKMAVSNDTLLQFVWNKASMLLLIFRENI